MAGEGRLRRLSGAVSTAARPVLSQIGPRVAVALSGGPDSAVCAWVAQEHGSVPRLVYVHHGLPASDQMRRAAGSIAARLGLGLEVLEISGWGKSEGRARSARYAALLGNLEQGEWLLTGHNLDDQAETVLLNLLRGSGLEGLAGIPTVRPPVARPLLDVRRSEIRELAGLLGLPWREDPANTDQAFRRNRLRSGLIPRLEAEWNPNLSVRLASMARMAASESAAIADDIVEPLEDRGHLLLPAAALWAVGDRRARHSIRAALRRLRPPHPPSSGELAEVLGVLTGERGRLTMSDGVEVVLDGPWLVLQRGPTLPVEEAPVEWEVPGLVAWGGFELQAEVSDQRPTAFPLSPWRAVMDAERVRTLTVRAPAESDLLSVPGGSQRLIEAIKSSGIDGQSAAGWPVVESEGQIVWVPGVRSLPAGWVDGSTRRYLWVSAEEVVWPR